MKKMKKTLCLFLALVMCLSLVNLSAFADEGTTLPEGGTTTMEEATGGEPAVSEPAENETPAAGSGDAQNPDEGSGDAQNPDEGSGDAQNPDEGSGDAQTPDEGSGDAQTPDEGSGDAQNPDEGDGDAQNPDEGSGDAQNPTEETKDPETKDPAEGEGENEEKTPAEETKDPAEGEDEADAEVPEEVQAFLDAVKELEALSETDDGYLQAMQDVVDAYNDLTGVQKDALELERAESGEKQTWVDWIEELKAKIEALSNEAEDEVPDAVQAFLDAVAELEAAVEAKDAEKALAQADVCEEAFNALSEEDMEREDVVAAMTKMAELIEKAVTLEETGDGVAMIGETSYETLQAAIDAVEVGSTDAVITLVGDTSENITIEGKALTLDLNGYTLTSGTVGQNVVTILGGTVTIQNGTITGGDYGNKTNQDGKGVLVNNASVTLKSCEITGNSGYGKKGTTSGYDGNSSGYGGFGGGIYATNSTLTVEQSIVSDNKATSGGGGIFSLNSTVTITDSKLLDNSCGSGSPSGGGIQVSGGTLNIDGTTISGNIASNGYGNAIALTGANVKVTIKNSEVSSTKAGSVIYAQYGSGPIDIDLDNVDIVNKTGTNTQYAIYSAVAGTFTAKNCTFHDSNGGIQLTKVTEQTYENCKFLNNDATYSSAGAPVCLKAGNASFTGCTFTGNKGYNAGGIYNTTTGTVTIDGCLFQGNSASNSTSAGAIYASKGSTTVTNTVVKENTTLGTNSSGPAGGISVYGSGTVFTMTSGAVYNNKSEKQSSPAHDIYVYSSAKANILAAKSMTDGEVDFSSYAWSDLSSNVIKEELTRSGNWTATPAAEHVATIGETTYKTLDDAFEAARAQSRKTGETVTVEVVGGYVPLNTYWGVSQKAADGPYAPSVTFHLNNTNIYGVGITNSFSVGAGSTLTLSGNGTLNKKIYMMGGTLNLDGNVVVSGGSLSFGKTSIFDDKSGSTININGDVDKVEIGLYKGTVTVGENAHVGTLEALMTSSSSGTPLETNFVMNGQVDNLLLTQSTSKSTATMNGTIGSLTLNQGTEIYGTRTFPTTTAGEKFSVNNLSVAPPLSSATSFDVETGRTADGMVSTAALTDPAQTVKDMILIHGGGDKVASSTWTTSYSFKHTDGKDYKFLTNVAADENNNVVLRKTVVNGNYVFLDGGNGDDINHDGTSLTSPVKTFAKAKELALAKGQNTIYVLGTVTISGSETWDGGITVESFPTFSDLMVCVPQGASLTLTNVTLDGKGVTRKTPLVENRGNLTLGSGAKLTGGVNTVIYGPNTGAGLDGGAVYNSGTLTMMDGEICFNTARTGGGVFSKGTFAMEGGSIHDNTGYGGRFSYSLGGSSKIYSAPAGGGVFLAGSSTMTMTGGDITNNSSCVGGGIALGNETNAYISYGGPTLIMQGGAIDHNTAKTQGGGIFIQEMCEATITGGKITNNHANGGTSVATGIGTMYGGGIYVNGGTGMTKKDGKLNLECVAITGNTAQGEGGGIAGCPSSNIDVNLNNGGVVAGNTGSGGPYDVAIFRGIVTGPGGSDHHGGVKFNLAKYMMGGALYKWYHWESKEPVFFQDVTYTTTQSGGFYSNAKAEIIAAAKARCTVEISGNTTNSRGAGIGTNGEVNIGRDPDLFDYFDVTITKTWLNEKGTPMTPEQVAELKENIESLTVQLYCRVVDESQGPEDNWELVDNRLILPNEEDFWEMNRPFTGLLKWQVDEDGVKHPLEYRVVEVASMTGAWKEIGGGVINLITPAIRETN